MANTNCGVFNVSFIIYGVDPPRTDDCLILMILTVGGTGLPLLLIIAILLCVLCCMCHLTRKQRKHSGSLDIEDNRDASNNHERDCTVEVKLTNLKLDSPCGDTFQDRLYDSVNEVKSTETGTAKEVVMSSSREALNNSSKTSWNHPQPYEDVVLSRQQLPVYAEPNMETSSMLAPASNTDCKRVSMPPTLTQYSQLHEQEKTEASNRLSVSAFPEGLYSSLGAISPPLPPRLDTENMPESSQQEEQVTLADANGREETGDMVAEGIDGGNENNAFYTNVSLQESQNANQSHISGSLDHFGNQSAPNELSFIEDEPEISQDLYVNI